MSEVPPVPVPAVAPARPGKKKTAPKPRKLGPSVSDLITKAVSDSKERNGISLPAIKKILVSGGYDVEKNNSRVKTAVKSLLEKEILVHTKGTGASGSFKISKEVKKPAAKKVVAAPTVKKAAVKKPVAVKKVTPKKAKKPAAKKPSAAKKTTPKKVKKVSAAKKVASKSPKKAVTKKTAPKKAAPKAAAAKKAPAKKAAKPKAAKKAGSKKK